MFENAKQKGEKEIKEEVLARSIVQKSVCMNYSKMKRNVELRYLHINNFQRFSLLHFTLFFFYVLPDDDCC